MIDSVVGTKLHEYFRETAKLSTIPDNRIGLDDFPENVLMNKDLRAQSFPMAYGHVKQMDAATSSEAFPDLAKFLGNSFSLGQCSVIVTIGEFSVSMLIVFGFLTAMFVMRREGNNFLKARKEWLVSIHFPQ